MLLFHGVCRKVALLPLSTLLLGWLVYLVGFALFMVKDDVSSVSRFDLLPHYIVTAALLPLVILAALHAALFGTPSAVLGLLTAVLSVVGFSSAGFVLYVCAVSLYNHLHFSKGGSLDTHCLLMFVGTLLSSLSWMCVLMMWNYFTYKPQRSAALTLDNIVDEDGTLNSSPPSSRTPPLFMGIARKVGVVFLLLNAACWCVFVTGVDKQVQINSTAHGLPELGAVGLGLPFDTWSASVIGILLVLSALLHAGANGKASALMGVMASILSMLYLVCMGHIVFTISIDMHARCAVFGACSPSDVPSHELYQWCGGVGGCVSWAWVLALWPFYLRESAPGQGPAQQRE